MVYDLYSDERPSLRFTLFFDRLVSRQVLLWCPHFCFARSAQSPSPVVLSSLLEWWITTQPDFHLHIIHLLLWRYFRPTMNQWAETGNPTPRVEPFSLSKLLLTSKSIRTHNFFAMSSKRSLVHHKINKPEDLMAFRNHLKPFYTPCQIVDSTNLLFNNISHQLFYLLCYFAK